MGPNKPPSKSFQVTHLLFNLSETPLLTTGKEAKLHDIINDHKSSQRQAQIDPNNSLGKLIFSRYDLKIKKQIFDMFV